MEDTSPESLRCSYLMKYLPLHQAMLNEVRNDAGPGSAAMAISALDIALGI
jgi:hypothetical protein